MDKAKQWIGLAALAALVLVAAGWFFVVAPTRAEAADLREQTAAQEGTNASLTTSLEVLRTKAQGLRAEQDALAEVARRIPPGPALPELLRSLEAAASSAGVDLVSVVPAPPVPVEAPAAAPAASGDPAAAAPAAPVAPGLSSLEVKMVVSGDFYAVEQFLALLEDLPRALRVTALSMDQASDGPAQQPGADRAVQASLTGLVYLAPSVPVAVAPAGGAPTAPADGAQDAPAPSSDSAPAS